MTLWNVEFGGGHVGVDPFNYTWTLGAGQSLVVQNDLKIGRSSTSGTVLVQGGHLQVQRDMTLELGAGLGTAQISFTGSAEQRYFNNGGSNLAGLHTVDKSSGSLILQNPMSLSAIAQNLTITSGTLDLNGQTLLVDSTLSIGSSGTLYCNGGTYASAVFINNGILDCAQVLAFTTQPSGAAETWTNFATQPIVTVQSLAGHTSNVSTNPITLAAFTDDTCSTASSAGLMASTNPLSATAGVASFTGVRHHLAETIYLGATSAGLTSDCSTAVVVTMLPYTWTGLGADANWNTTANWSSNAVPGSSHTAIFDANCGATCNATMNVNVNVAGMAMRFPYTGTITQSSGQAVTIGSSNWIQDAGSFVGSDTNITLTGSLNLNAGSFTSTSANLDLSHDVFIAGGVVTLIGTVDIRRNFTYTSGTVDTTGAAVRFTSASNADDTTITTSAGFSFESVEFRKTNASSSMTISGTVTTHSLTIANNTPINGGTVVVTGNLTMGSGAAGGSATIVLAGNSNQTLSGIAGANLPNLHIDSTGGVITLTGTVDIRRNFTYTSGTVDTTGAVVRFTSTSNFDNTTITTSAGFSFESVEFRKTNASSSMTISGTVTTHSLTIANNTPINGGTVVVTGNLTMGSGAAGGSATIVLAGNSPQTLTGSSGRALPNLVFESTSTVTLVGIIDVDRNLTYISGTLDAGSSTVRLTGGNAATLNLDSQTLNNLNLMKGVSGGSINIVGTTTVLGNLVVSNAGSINGGTLSVKGNVMVSNGGGGTGTIVLSGASPQALTVSGGTLPSLTFESDSDILLGGTVRLQRHLTYISGTLDAGTSHVIVTGSQSDGNHNSSINLGSQALNNLSIIVSVSGAPTTIVGTATVLGNLTINSPSRTNGGTIELHGNFHMTNNQSGSTASIWFSGSGLQTYSRTGGTLPVGTFTVDKTGGSLTLNSAMSLTGTGQQMQVTQGTVEMNGQDLTVAGALTIAAGGVINCSAGILSYGSLSNSGTLNCP